MQGITLENVVFYDMKKNSKPFDQDYYCPEGGVIESQGLGETSPMPPCMLKKSN